MSVIVVSGFKEDALCNKAKNPNEGNVLGRVSDPRKLANIIKNQSQKHYKLGFFILLKSGEYERCSFDAAFTQLGASKDHATGCWKSRNGKSLDLACDV